MADIADDDSADEAYAAFFVMNYERVQDELPQMIYFAVRYFDLILFSDQLLRRLARCPGDPVDFD